MNRRLRNAAILISAAAILLSLASVPSRAAGNPQVLFTTSEGQILVELFAGRAPETVENVVNYVKAGQYDGTIFHRVIPGFMIQGGGFTPNMQQRPTGKPIKNEADNGERNLAGTLAMARTGEPHSATAQFFKCLLRSWCAALAIGNLLADRRQIGLGAIQIL